MATAAILTVGNELLFGQTVDTNATWLAERLAAVGYTVVSLTSVGDDESAIGEAVRELSSRAALVVCTGGLGPTADDVTKKAVAESLDVELPNTLENQYEVRSGVRAFENPIGTAPGLVISTAQGAILLLPGVPREMMAIVNGALGEWLEATAGGGSRLYHRVVHTTGVPESRLASEVERALAKGSASTEGVEVAFLPGLIGVDLRFSTRAGSSTEAYSHLDRVVTSLDDVLRPWRFESADGDLVSAVRALLEDRGLTLSVAESCTGGILAKRFTDRPGAGRVFLGGVVAYSNHAKSELLGVKAELLHDSGAVSEPVARALASGAVDRFGSDVGVAITGVAGPDGGSLEKPVGSVWYAVALGDRTEARLGRFAGDRTAVRERSAQAALDLLYRMLLDPRSDGDALK